MDVVEFVKANEGFSGAPYKCPAGYLTIGYGHNLDANPVSERVATVLLQEDIREAVRNLHTIFDNVYSMPNSKRIALTDMMFNLGLPRFRSFKRMIAAAKAGMWVEVAKEAKNSRWYTQVGHRGERVVALMEETDLC